MDHRQWFCKKSFSTSLFISIFTTLLFFTAAHANDSEQQSQEVDPYFGSYSTQVPIEVPAFHGLEPKLQLQYNSTKRNGLLGVGWSLSAGSIIERGLPGGGSPKYDANDAYFLDGQELMECSDQGGTHCTEIQNYSRIVFEDFSDTDITNDVWYVYGTNGNLATYSQHFTTTKGNFRWYLTSVLDTHGNEVIYTYEPDGDLAVYLDTITYNGTTVTFYRESRADVITFATGASLGKVRHRLKTVDVQTSGSQVRAYTLTYDASATSSSLLVNVQQYGNDVTLDISGNILSGTFLPNTIFTYNDYIIGFTDSISISRLLQGDSVNVLVGDFNGDGKSDLFRAYVDQDQNRILHI